MAAWLSRAAPTLSSSSTLRWPRTSRSTPPKNALGGDNDHFDTRTGVRGPMRQFKLGASYTF
jgi:hypothetical protein